MFCGNCGSKAVEGDRFCVTCGQAPRPASASQSVPVLVHDPEIPQPYPSAPWRPFSGQATWAFVLSLLWLGGLGSICAIALAYSAMQDIRKGTHSGQGLAVAALVLGILGIGISVFYLTMITVMGNDLNNQFSQLSACLNSPKAPGCP
jgi:hypothetical protein